MRQGPSEGSADQECSRGRDRGVVTSGRRTRSYGKNSNRNRIALRTPIHSDRNQFSPEDRDVAVAPAANKIRPTRNRIDTTIQTASASSTSCPTSITEPESNPMRNPTPAQPSYLFAVISFTARDASQLRRRTLEGLRELHGDLGGPHRSDVPYWAVTGRPRAR